MDIAHPEGGGIYNKGNLTITNCNIKNNYAYTNGGGIYNDHGNITVINSNIKFNTAKYGGGIFNYHGNCNVANSNITNNTVSGGGGGIINIGACNVANSNITNNTAGDGGGIYNEGSTCKVINSNIKFNTAKYGGGGIDNIYSGSFTVTNSNITSNNADFGGGVNNDRGTCKVINSTIKNNTAVYGGGINNKGDNFDLGTFTLTGSSINSNKAYNGGGIYNNVGNCTLISSNINYNNALSGGGIYNQVGNLTVTNCIIKNNTATGEFGCGGGIANRDKMIVTGCNFDINTAPIGNAIYNVGGVTSSRVVKYNRFYDGGHEIYSVDGGVNALFNWWGSNANPANKVTAINGAIYNGVWLVLTINSTKNIIKKDVSSTITADLLHYKDSAGGSGITNPTNGHIINGIPITFKTSKGSINSPVKLVNGVANATLTSGTFNGNGTANVTATLDSQTVNKYVTIDTVAPTISSISPSNGATGVPRNKIITVTFNEPVKWSSKWIEIKANGVTVPTSAYTMSLSSDGKTLTIKPTTGTLWKANTTYTVILHTGCVKDYAGNSLAVASRSFKTGST